MLQQQQVQPIQQDVAQIQQYDIEDAKTRKEKEKEFDKQRQAEIEEERIVEMKERVSKISSFIPISFYFRVLIGFVLIIAFPLVYTIVAVVASLQNTKYDHVIFLSGYRTTLMMIMASLACNMAVVFRQKIPKNDEQIPPFSVANPFWNTLRHMKNNVSELQNLVGSQINTIVLLGTANSGIEATGDSIIDGATAVRTITSGSQTEVIQYNSTQCFENKIGSCEKQERVYSLFGQFKGLEALLGMLYASATILTNLELKDDQGQQINTITMKTPEIQILISLMIYDLRGGCTRYRAAILSYRLLLLLNVICVK
ncbi:MAG: hypothetical protein EZS28_027142 [Streblomastix strix]|uniref:Uncharacterized protein n=1 Tax=Streblomastix strix TaxID=222440 RepID=A0A5J4V4Q1_9EUKA|nr:MAG: hypothetical protein EZS28_027142 [Streblomastix strix]